MPSPSSKQSDEFGLLEITEVPWYWLHGYAWTGILPFIFVLLAGSLNLFALFTFAMYLLATVLLLFLGAVLLYYAAPEPKDYVKRARTQVRELRSIVVAVAKSMFAISGVGLLGSIAAVWIASQHDPTLKPSQPQQVAQGQPGAEGNLGVGGSLPGGGAAGDAASATGTGELPKNELANGGIPPIKIPLDEEGKKLPQDLAAKKDDGKKEEEKKDKSGNKEPIDIAQVSADRLEADTKTWWSSSSKPTLVPAKFRVKPSSVKIASDTVRAFCLSPSGVFVVNRRALKGARALAISYNGTSYPAYVIPQIDDPVFAFVATDYGPFPVIPIASNIAANSRLSLPDIEQERPDPFFSNRTDVVPHEGYLWIKDNMVERLFGFLLTHDLIPAINSDGLVGFLDEHVGVHKADGGRSEFGNIPLGMIDFNSRIIPATRCIELLRKHDPSAGAEQRKDTKIAELLIEKGPVDEFILLPSKELQVLLATDMKVKIGGRNMPLRLQNVEVNLNKLTSQMRSLMVFCSFKTPEDYFELTRGPLYSIMTIRFRNKTDQVKVLDYMFAELMPEMDQVAASLLDQINDFTAISADVSTKLHERFEAYMRGGNEFALCSHVYCKIAPDQTNPVLIELARKAGKPQKVPERIVHGLAAGRCKEASEVLYRCLPVIKNEQYEVAKAIIELGHELEIIEMLRGRGLSNQCIMESCRALGDFGTHDSIPVMATFVAKRPDIQKYIDKLEARTKRKK